MAKKSKKPFNSKDPRIKALLSKRTPATYIDYCVNGELTSREKMLATPIWLEKTGYTIKDIQYARNRHPYWKAKKMKNSKERNQSRIEKYYYYDGPRQNWTEDYIKEFLDINDKMTDREMAQHFKRSIPAIQYIRRKMSLCDRILGAKGKSPKDLSTEEYMVMIQKDERSLREEAWKGEKSRGKKKRARVK